MSDVDTTEEGREVAIQGSEEQEVTDPVAEAIAEVNPPGVPVYPENDVVRAVLSGMPAGNADDVPEGTEAVKAAMQESLAGGEDAPTYERGSKPEFVATGKGAKAAALNRGQDRRQDVEA